MEFPIQTPVMKLLGIKNPIILAGMNKASGSKLCAEVSNQGGLGVFGGLNYTPKILRRALKKLKADLKDPSLPFGVDLALPQVGGGARKTNYDYTKGNLMALTDVIIDEGAKLFVCAIGACPKKIVDKLHSHGILVMNMVGHPKHVAKCLDNGVDLICCQGSEGGGHTGTFPTFTLIPAALDACRGRRSPLTGEPIYVVAGGGVYDGRGLAMALAAGAQAVWVGTRFVASTESSASDAHKQAIASASYEDTTRTELISGRPLRMIMSDYIRSWEGREAEAKDLMDKGIIPFVKDVKSGVVKWKGDLQLAGQCSGAIQEVLPAKVIMQRMLDEATELLTNISLKMNAKL